MSDILFAVRVCNQIVAVILVLGSFSVSGENSKTCLPVPPGGTMDKECKTAVVQSPKTCVNKRVIVTAGPGRFEDIKLFFMLFSNLPYETTILKSEPKRTVISISYWGEGPSSFELATRVQSSLESKFKEWGIVKISADFIPNQKCP